MESVPKRLKADNTEESNSSFEMEEEKIQAGSKSILKEESKEPGDGMFIENSESSDSDDQCDSSMDMNN